MPSRLGAKMILSRVDCIAILHDEAELMPWMDRWTYRDDAVSMEHLEKICGRYWRLPGRIDGKPVWKKEFISAFDDSNQAMEEPVPRETSRVPRDLS